MSQDDEIMCIGGDFINAPQIEIKRIDWSKIPTCQTEGCDVRPLSSHEKYCPFHGHYRTINHIKNQTNLEDFMDERTRRGND